MKTLQFMPTKLETMTRTATYGSWFNFYLCGFDGNVVLPTGTRIPVSHDVNSARWPVMRPFREQNQVTIGVVGLTVIGLIMLAAFRAQDLPLIGGGLKYSAQLSEAGGVKPNDEIRVAGVRVGQVRKVELEGSHVRVDFVVDRGVQARRRDRRRGEAEDAARPEVHQAHPEGRRAARRGLGDPAGPDHLGVRRGRRLLGPGGHHRADRHRPAGEGARHLVDHLREHAGGGARLADRAVPAVQEHRGPGRPAEEAAAALRGRHQGPCRPEQGAHHPAQGRQQGVPGGAGAAGADPPAARLDAGAVRPDHRAGPGEPQGPRARPCRR